MSDREEQHQHNRLAFTAILLGYVCLAVAYSLVNPLFESPDEFNHYDFVRYLIDRHELPVQTLGKQTEYFEPPLYYAISSLVIGAVPTESYTPQVNPFFGYEAYRFGVDNKALYIHSAQEAFPYQGTALAVHLLRGFSILLGTLSLIIAFRALCEVFKRPALALGAVALIAFNPQFILVSSSISNDNLIILLSMLMTWLAIRIAQSGMTTRHTVIMAVLTAAAVLTKLSAAVLILVLLAGMLIARTPRRKWISTLLIVSVAGLLLTGWWFLRNLSLYGEPTGIRMWQQIWGWQSGVVNISDVGVALQNLWTSYWGRFGWGQIVLPDEVYGALLVIGLFSLIGLVRNLHAWRTRAGSPSSGAYSPDVDPRGLGILMIAFGLVLAASLWYGLVNPAGTAGRFWFPAIMPIGGLMFYGLRGLYRPEQAQLDGWFVSGVYGLMIVLSLGSLIGVIAPAYAAPAPMSLDEVRRQTRSVDIRFGDAAQLIGYTLDRDRLNPGEELHVTLCWQTLKTTSTNIYFFLHLLGANNAIVARRESLPGLGRYPSTQWVPNYIFCDNVPLRVEENAAGAKVYNLEVGLVDLASGMRLPPINPIGVELQPAILGQVKVRALQQVDMAATGMQPGAVDLGRPIRLTGSEVVPASIRAHDAVSVTLIWQSIQVPTADYTVFVHLRDASGHTVAQADGPPQAGAYPTSFWDAGETVVDDHTIDSPDDLPAGDYTVVVGLYRLDTGERLAITQGGGSEIVLPQIVRVR
jgi:4-amino-4-deoxy-L-arabinose transferase-like glycosyltransferase